MSVNSISGMTPQTAPYHSQPVANGAKKAEDSNDQELTTITTHCNKKHKHDQSCPHTVSTRPAPKAGEPGNILDKSI